MAALPRLELLLWLEPDKARALNAYRDLERQRILRAGLCIAAQLADQTR